MLDLTLFIYAGYFFGTRPWVEKNFKLVIVAIIILSILPAIFEFWRARRESAAKRAA